MAERPLTGKQKQFVVEYLADLNATQAAIRARYSRRNAGKTGLRNLRNPKILAAIAEAQAPRLAKLDMDAAAVLNELAKIARASPLDYMRINEDGEPIVDLRGLDRDRAAALSEVTVEDFPSARGAGKREVRRVKFRLYDKLSALDKLAKHFRLLSERASPAIPDESERRPQHDPRQVARAVLAILEEAAIAEESEDVEERVD
jgi:phage terminase small subunit